ncbi:hypothetical protein LCGC14_1904220 [marine sediment metagenome]|uniref:Uncharacterized protein n=1 Tax=marine sediment metagenome TaxID=412755 RepID=A0A0F9FVM5_9ZZZZ
MRTYHSPTLGDVHLTEAQYRKLLRRFDPNKKIGVEYKHPYCMDCKPFGYIAVGCLRYLDDVTGHPCSPRRTALGSYDIKVWSSEGLDDLTTIHTALLGMVKT